MKVSPRTAPDGPASRARLLRAVGTIAAMLVMGLSASTAVALADDGRPGDPGQRVATTLVDGAVTTVAQKPPTTPPAPTTDVTAGLPGCGNGLRGDQGGTSRDCHPGARVPDPPTAATAPPSTAPPTTAPPSTAAPTTAPPTITRPPITARPTTTAPPTTAPPTTARPATTARPTTTAPATSVVGGGVDTPVAPGSSAPVGDTGSGAPGTVSESAADDGSPQGLSIAGAGDTGTSGGATPDGTQGSGESAIAPFGQTELADGGLLAPSDSIDSAPPFSSRLWAALPLGLLIGLVLVGVALGAVRIARLGTTP